VLNTHTQKKKAMQKTSTHNAINRIAMITFAIVAMWVMPKVGSAQTTFYYYNGTGAPDAVTSWGTNADGTGTNPANFTTAGCNFYFTGNNGSKKVSLPTTFSVTGAKAGTLPASKVVDSLGVNLIVPVGGLAAATTIGVSDTSWLTLQDTMNVKLGTLKPTSTVAYDGAATLNILAGTYGNLISTNDSLATRIIPKRTITIVGNFDEGMATFSDTLSTITYKGTSVQHVAPISYYSLTITNTAGTVIDSGAIVTILGGKLSVSKGDSLSIMGGGNLVYASRTAATLTGPLHLFTGGTLTINRNLAAVPAATFDSASNLALGDGTDSLTVLPKLSAKVTYGNVTINAPFVATSLGSRFLPDTKGSYNINGDLNIVAGKATNSNSGTKGAAGVAKSLVIWGDLNVSGGTYTICDSSAANDKDSIVGGINVTGGALFVTNNSTLAGHGSIYISSDLMHTGGLFGNATTSTIGGRIFFNDLDTAGQGLVSLGFNNDTIAPLRLEVMGGNEVEVLSNITVNDTLVLTKGFFTVDSSFQLTINKGVKGYNDSTNWIITDALAGVPAPGMVRFNNVPKNTFYTFPLGNDSTYQPISIQTTDDSTSFTFVTHNGLTSNGDVVGNPLASVVPNAVNSAWQITRNDAGKAPVTVVFNWDSTMEGPAFVGLPNSVISVFQNDGSGTLTAIPTQAFHATDSCVVTLTTFGYFIIAANNSPLALKFENVAAEQKGETIEVSWKTANEQNMNGYTVERSSDGTHFISVGNVAANDKSTNVYDFKDAGYANGENYYRIKAIDKTGAATYSSIVKVSVSETINKSISIYPNPVIGKVISIALNNQNASVYNVQLVSSNGKTLASKQINHLGGSSVNTFDVSSLNVKGLYFLKITSAEGQTTTKTVLIK